MKRNKCINVILTVMVFLVVIQTLGSAEQTTAESASYADFSDFDEALAANGINARLGMIEYFTAADSGHTGATIYAKDVGNKQMHAHWVPADPRRGGHSDISYIMDSTEIPLIETESAIDRAMSTWDDQTCSDLPITKIPSGLQDLGIVQYLIYEGGSPIVFADITHAGWLPGDFFDLIEAGGSAFILGATFTAYWVDGNGDLTDINNDRKYDVAFREIYYNNNEIFFDWSTNPHAPGEIDVESVVLHEAGRGLSQDHFWMIFRDGRKNRPGGLHFAPKAVMNAAYTGVERELHSTDIGGHCSIWAEWPN